MAAKMWAQPSEPLEQSRAVTPLLIAHGVGRDSDDRSAHKKVEPQSMFTGKGLPIVHDWVEEIEN